MNSIFRFSILILIIQVFLSSCKKFTNDDAVITITNPSSGSVFMAGDTILVEASMNDDDALGILTIKLLNAAYTPVSHQEQYALNHLDEYEFSMPYVIDNLYLESGNYYITVSLSDGDEDANEYRSIVIHELPRTRDAVYFLTQPDTQNVHVLELDSMGQLQNRLTIQGDYAESAVNSRYNQLIVSGNQYGNYNQFELETYTNVFSEPPYNGSGPSFQNLFFYNNLTYVSFYDGRIRAYDRLGNIKFNSEQPVFYQPGALCANSKYVFAEAFYSGQSERRLVVINNPSGVPRQEYNLGIEIASILSMGENDVMIFGNNNGDGKIYSYEVLNNDADDLHALPGITIYSAVAIDADNYALATQNGLYSYQVSNNNLIPVDVNQPCNAVEYDVVNGILFSASGNNVRQYAFPAPQVLNTTTCTDPVLDIRILYNK